MMTLADIDVAKPANNNVNEADYIAQFQTN